VTSRQPFVVVRTSSVLPVIFLFCLLGCKQDRTPTVAVTSAGTQANGVYPAQPPEPGMSLIDGKLRSMAGYGVTAALNCGWVGIRQDPTAASDCALKAFAHKRPFYVRYDLQGIDSSVSAGLAGGISGNVYFVEYDSMGWETDGLAKGAEVTDGKHIYVEPCPNPVKLRKTQTGRLSCVPPNRNAKQNIMSPTFDPY
jgi:hypothetical protein